MGFRQAIGRPLARLTGDDRWEDWTPEILSHIIQGAACGVGMACGSWELFAAGFAWMLFSCFYQLCGFLKKNDTVAKDVRDYLVGCAPAWGITKVVFALMRDNMGV